jgi:hypothetical protein
MEKLQVIKGTGPLGFKGSTQEKSAFLSRVHARSGNERLTVQLLGRHERDNRAEWMSTVQWSYLIKRGCVADAPSWALPDEAPRGLLARHPRNH